MSQINEIEETNYLFGYDSSTATWLTDFIWCAITIYLCKIVYKKYNSQKKGYIKNIFLYLFLINLFIVLTTFFGGITHLLFYKNNTLLNKIFWKLTIIFTSIASILFIGLIILLTFNIKNLYVLNLSIFIICCLILLLELISNTNYVEYFSLTSYILIPILSIPLLSNLKKNSSIKTFAHNKFIFAMLLFFCYTAFYSLYLKNICSIPNAYKKGCIFPDWFNHNAILHIIYAIAYYYVNTSITKMS